MPGWLIALICLPLYLIATVVAYHVEKRVVKEDDEDGLTLCAIFWPFRLAWLLSLCALGLPVLIIMGIGLALKALFKITDGVVDRIVGHCRPAENLDPGLCEKPAPKPRIIIPDGAEVGLEEYRRLKPMIERFERHLPLLERG
jgi:hypothetical protein